MISVAAPNETIVHVALQSLEYFCDTCNFSLDMILSHQYVSMKPGGGGLRSPKGQLSNPIHTITHSDNKPATCHLGYKVYNKYMFWSSRGSQLILANQLRFSSPAILKVIVLS